MRFRELTTIAVVTTIAGKIGPTVALAIAGFGVWALVAGVLLLVANGFFNEHYVAPPQTDCTQKICLTPGVSVGRDWLTGNHQATLQIAVNTNIDPTTLERKPLNLVVVVDRSGSMYEDNRMEKVKTGLRTLVENLEDTDRLAIVQFDDQVDVLAPFAETLNRPQLLSLVDSLQPRGSTNIYGGLAGIGLILEAGVPEGVVFGNFHFPGVGNVNNLTIAALCGASAAGSIGRLVDQGLVPGSDRVGWPADRAGVAWDYDALLPLFRRIEDNSRSRRRRDRQVRLPPLPLCEKHLRLCAGRVFV